MGLAVFKERRLSSRKQLTGLLPGRIVNPETGQDIACRPVDVTEHGLGIVVTSNLEPLRSGLVLNMVLKEGVVPLIVLWSKPDFGKSDQVRYGLVVQSEKARARSLEAIFASHGCIRSE